ncbi:hypothetical protein [Nostoc sp.]|uniref:hypothetical protein n=1 Tax=Nostoc sp. TaxID=1180 RepID=UPI002FF7CAA9
MNKFAKGLIIALAIATPVAIAAPIFQATPASAAVRHYKHHYKGIRHHHVRKHHP